MSQGGGALQFDQAASRRVEAMYLTPDVVGQRREVLGALGLAAGERVLDIGSGPGLLALEMAEAVGPGGRVVGIDISESFLAMSRARCSGQPWVEFHEADATALPFAAGEFDAAVSTQVYEYVSGITAALRELRRVLRRGGRALILDTDWDTLAWHSDDPGRMRRILAAWDEHLVDPHLPRTLGRRLEESGFRVDGCTVVPLLNSRFGSDTYSHGLIGLITEFVGARQRIPMEEVSAWAEDLRTRGGDRPYFFSLNRYLFAATRT